MNSIPRTDTELLLLVQEVSLEYFAQPFVHEGRFNPRLRSTGGRYLLISHDIEINSHYAVHVGFEGLIDTIKHELCHYHLHLGGHGYRHRDSDFKHLLARVGGAKYAERSALSIRHRRYEYHCQTCETPFFRKNRLNLHMYVCSHCKGKLYLFKEHVVKL